MSRGLQAPRVLIALAALLVLVSSWTWAAPCCGPSPAAASPSPASATAQIYPNEAHGYTLRLPVTWRYKQRTSDSDAADVRFQVVDRAAISGSYQVFEGAVTEDPTHWYNAAKKQYEDRAGSIPAIASLTVKPLQDATLGGSPAHAFEFDTVLRDGATVTTRIVFVVRRNGERADMHELIVTGEQPAFEAHRADIEKLSSAVEWTPQRSGE